MVSNNHVNPMLEQPCNLWSCGNTIINRNDKIGLLILNNALKRRLRKTVALIKAMRNVGAHMLSTQTSQRKRQQTGG